MYLIFIWQENPAMTSQTSAHQPTTTTTGVLTIFTTSRNDLKEISMNQYY